MIACILLSMMQVLHSQKLQGIRFVQGKGFGALITIPTKLGQHERWLKAVLSMTLHVFHKTAMCILCARVEGGWTDLDFAWLEKQSMYSSQMPRTPQRATSFGLWTAACGQPPAPFSKVVLLLLNPLHFLLQFCHTATAISVQSR
jgi:hypothetical protein